MMAKGDKEKGGSELEYLSSIIIRFARVKDLTKQKDKKYYKYGIVTKAKVRKNHLFDGKDSVAELMLVVSADGIQQLEEAKGKATDVVGWDDEGDE
jgi:hypothetical protein